MTHFVLSMQSQVAYGHVGNSAAQFALQRLGIEAVALPTAVLSNHPGHGQMSGRRTAPEELRALWAGLGRLAPPPVFSALLSGYLGQPESGAVLLEIAAGLKADHKEALWLCDPVIGDSHTGPYVPERLGAFFREQAVPRADIVTPNQFELGYLTGNGIADRPQLLAAARTVLSQGPGLVVCTSVTAGLADGRIGSLAITGDQAWLATTARLTDPPHGGGDLFAALFLAHRLAGTSVPDSLAKATASTFGLMQETLARGHIELPLIAAQKQLVDPELSAVEVTRL